MKNLQIQRGLGLRDTARQKNNVIVPDFVVCDFLIADNPSFGETISRAVPVSQIALGDAIFNYDCFAIASILQYY